MGGYAMRFDSDPRVCATVVGPFCWPILLVLSVVGA